jgi:hypothetical protein
MPQHALWSGTIVSYWGPFYCTQASRNACTSRLCTRNTCHIRTRTYRSAYCGPRGHQLQLKIVPLLSVQKRTGQYAMVPPQQHDRQAGTTDATAGFTNRLLGRSCFPMPLHKLTNIESALVIQPKHISAMRKSLPMIAMAVLHESPKMFTSKLMCHCT